MVSLSATAAGRIAVIAHRGHHASQPENSIAAIESAITLGCDYVEIDVRTSRDGRYILSHDATFGPGVPALDDALETMRGRCAVYFDAKAITATAIIDALRQHRMLDAAVVYGRHSLLTELAARGYGHLAMPEAVSVADLRRALTELKPRTVAFDRRDFRNEIIAVARDAKAGIFVDRLGPDDTPEAWHDAIRRGATGIQTDRPAELLAALTSR